MDERERIKASDRDLAEQLHKAHVDAAARQGIPLTDRFDGFKSEGIEDSFLAILDKLRRDRDLSEFQKATDSWTRSFESGFKGFSGQVVLSQINKRSKDPLRTADVLANALTVPVDLDDAQAKIDLLVEDIESMQEGSFPRTSNAAFLCSYFWALLEPKAWPAAWPNSMKYLEYVTGYEGGSQSERYKQLFDFASNLDGQLIRFERTAYWWWQLQGIHLTEVLCDRAAFSVTAENIDTFPNLYLPNARSLVLAGEKLAKDLKQDLSNKTRHKLVGKVSNTYLTKTRPRGDFWVEWRIRRTYGLGIRLHLNHKGMAIGFRPFPDNKPGYAERGLDVVKANPIEGYRPIAGSESAIGDKHGFIGAMPEEFIYGKWFPRESFDTLNLNEELLNIAEETRPLFDFFRPPEEGSVETSDSTQAPVAEEADLRLAETLGNIASETLLDTSFIRDVYELLNDKGQVIFYGPPGTGKTFVAKIFGEALAPDDACRVTVQFHPSTSYEDFVEGYRPVVDDHGTMTYQMAQGPLSRIAESARANPDTTYVMLIDEINRANLPKVFGELLYLLEYRDEMINTLYRPDDGFALPRNVWIIGTMNTADRSIALVDAALRRRFHFVPFFPNQGAVGGLLARWLEENEEPAWVDNLVNQVNGELSKDLGGNEFQIGHSHFMKSGLSQASLERIWKYNIEPLLTDIFFNEPDKIRKYEFGNVWAKFSDLEPELIEESESASDGDA